MEILNRIDLFENLFNEISIEEKDEFHNYLLSET